MSRTLDEAKGKLRELGPLVGRLIEEAARVERQRCDRENAVERERTKAAIDEMEKDIEAARQESHGYSEDLDRLEEERADLLGRHDALEKELVAERKKTASLGEDIEGLQKDLARSERRAEQAVAEAAKHKELREASEQSLSKLDAQFAAVSDSHRKEMSETRDAHREELAIVRADYKESEDRARTSAADLSKANATIRQLRKQLARSSQDQASGNDRPD